MERAALTQEQANALEAALKKESADAILKSAAREWETWFNECQALNFVDLPTIARALLVGYEVEEIYYPGDKLIRKDGTSFTVGTKIMTVVGRQELSSNYPYVRRATAEEVFWFEQLGRESVGDFYIGDVLIDSNQISYVVTHKDDAGKGFLDIRRLDFWIPRLNIRGILPEECYVRFPKEMAEGGFKDGRRRKNSSPNQII